ncbi:hypothetical protein [Methanoculleus sp.]|uniref:DUF7557 family protein n=1 Tax=Methanoculleus sp. TaxID=90427 RepID=UPI001BD64F5D|nr:hypothetical protein [Methanoculleus sp.]
MPDTSSIKISTELKYRLNGLKVHPRETYNDLIGRLVSHAHESQLPTHIPLIYVRVRGEIRELAEPIMLCVEVENGEYILYNHAYRLLAVAPNLREGLMEITAEFETNWKDFVERDESDLTGGALQFRRKLFSLFHGES